MTLPPTAILSEARAVKRAETHWVDRRFTRGWNPGREWLLSEQVRGLEENRPPRPLQIIGVEEIGADLDPVLQAVIDSHKYNRARVDAICQKQVDTELVLP
jgi:hypothetical protein